MVILKDTLEYQNKKVSTFHLSGQPLPTTDCYTYLGIPFYKTLSLRTFIIGFNDKIFMALYSVKNFLKNLWIPIPFKKTIIHSYIISKVSYFALIMLQ